jgi:hypothetical protein
MGRWRVEEVGFERANGERGVRRVADRVGFNALPSFEIHVVAMTDSTSLTFPTTEITIPLQTRTRPKLSTHVPIQSTSPAFSTRPAGSATKFIGRS